MKLKIISTRADEVDIRALDRIARNSYRNRSQVIYEAIRTLIERKKQEKTNART